MSNTFSCIEKFNIISFDIFDTLLKRDVLKPTDVFSLVETMYQNRYGNAIEFKNKRIIAEKQAREKSEYNEITIEEIYKEIDIEDKDVLQSLELEVEASVLHCNTAIKQVYDKCLHEGKKIYIISDMYLPKQFLEDILQREGYSGYIETYVSCDYRKTKRSGELYKEFCFGEGISPNKVLHIGDSRYADYIGARKAGIKAIHIPRLVENTLYLQKPNEDSDLNKRSFYAFQNNRITGCKNREKQLGYEILGPILYVYCQWIHDHFEEIKRDSKRLWFAARDMYLFKEAYDMLYDTEASPDYMYISRKSLRPILTTSTGDIAESGNAFPRGECTLGEIVKRMGYTAEDLDSDEDLEIKVNPRKLSDYPKVKEALSSPTIIEKEQKLADNGIRYLNEHGFLDSDVVLADVGWHGTTQYILQKILDSRKIDKHIYGLYLGCLDSTDERIGRDNYQAFAFDEQHDSDFAKGILLFEALILAPHGSTVFYRNEEGEVKPVLGNPDNVSDFLKNVQAGAIQFVREYKESILCQSITLNASICTEAFCKMVMEPKKEELNTIGQMDYDDFGIGKMAAPKSLITYIAHPRQLHHDLKHSPWRIGFLYKLFKVRLPYAKIYSFMRKKQGKTT